MKNSKKTKKFKKYKVQKIREKYDSAHQTCKAWGGYLFSIGSKAERDKIVSYLNKMDRKDG